jgi:hydrogenase-4 component B
MTIQFIILASFAVLLLGAAACLFMPYSRRSIGWVSLGFQTVASLGFLYVALAVLAGGAYNPDKPLFLISGLGASFLLKVDALSAIFLLVIAVVSWAAGLFSVQYMQHYKESLARYYPLFLLFILGMFGVVVVRDLFFFIVFWEFMTLTSYGLVVYEWGEKKNVNAGFKYFLMTHIGTAGVIIAANVLYHYSQSFDLDALRPVMGLLASDNPALLHTVLLLFFLGFATKAGVFPFGDWLPDAHPAAPSPVSAILSGVMIKIGIYGLLRVFWGMLPVSSYTHTWGTVMAVFGAGSLFIGTMAALYQNDTKRMLAFSSVGQIGYVMLALGTSLAFATISPAVAALALAAALFHIVSHSMSKSLLFLTAGSLQYKTGQRQLDLLGGLGKYMRWSAAAALTAGLGLAGFPLLGGFASKWLIYQATLNAGSSMSFILICGLLALFTSLLTLAVVVKYFGLSFLGQRTERNKEVSDDVPVSMRTAQLLLAAAVVLQGLLAAGVFRGLYAGMSSLLPPGYWPPLASLADLSNGGLALNFGEGFVAWYRPLHLLLILGGLGGLAWLLWRAGGARVKVSELWYSGEVQSPEQVRYLASSYFMTFKQHFNIRVGGYSQEGVYPRWPVPKLRKSFKLKHLLDVDDWLYRPLAYLGRKTLEGFSRTHSGIPQWYLLWMVLGAAVAMAVMFLVR